MSTPAQTGPRVVQVSPFVPHREMEPRDLLDEWRSLRDVARAASYAGCGVTVLQAAATAADLELDGVRFVFVGEGTVSPLRRRAPLWLSPIPRGLFRKAGELGADLIHFHSLSFPRHLTHLRRALPHLPVLVQDHADGPPPAWRAFLHRRSLEGVAGVAVTAAEQARGFGEAGALPEDVPVFPVLENSSDFRPGDVDDARSRTGLYGDPCLVWLGNLSPVKDPLTVLEGLSRATDSLKDPHLWCFYRHAPLLEDVRARISRDEALRDRVHLMGGVSHEEVEVRLRAADFLVQGSRREGSGYAVIEALACGTTPLVTDIPSFRVITGEGRVGALSRVGDAGAMADAIVDWAGRDRDLLRRRARAHFEDALSFPVLGRRLREVYEAAISGARGHVGADVARAQ